MTTPPVAMSIAGSDSSGGAGIQADLRTFAAHRVHGTTAITALTAQNTLGVQGVHAVSGAFVADQVRSITDDLDVRAVKTGMLATAEIVETVAYLAADGLLPNLVVDPVMVSSTGHRLLDEGAEAAYRNDLIPRATLITPNVEEAMVLTGRELPSIEAVVAAAVELAEFGPAVVITGGDTGAADQIVDVIVVPHAEPLIVANPRVDTGNDHGTGCSMSSAIAARLARGDDLEAAVTAAREFVLRALRGGAGWRLGAGHGPIDHLNWTGLAPQEVPVRADRGARPTDEPEIRPGERERS